MRLGSQRWLRVVFLATALVFIGLATYVYAFRFFDWLESDAAVPALLAVKVLHTGSPIAGDWYYANGDLWLVAPHLIAALPVAILGVGPTSLLVGTAIEFLIQAAVLAKIYLRLSGEKWIALFATMVTCMAWSNEHVAYAYIQLAYGFLTFLCMMAFYAFAALAQDTSARPWRFAAASLAVAAATIDNPARALIYVLGPLLFVCSWPWRGFAMRRRFALAAAAISGWVFAYGLYWFLARFVEWSVPRGHLEFAFATPSQIFATFSTLGRGLVMLCAGGAGPAVRAVPGALLLAGAFALVLREAMASRESTALRWLSVVVLAQLGAVLVSLLVIGNLLDGPEAVRYLIPSLLAMLGLAVVIAVRSVAEHGAPWWRRVAIGWLTAVPVAALVAATDVSPPTPVIGIWPDAAELDKVADELVRRGLTHGFAGNLAANLLTLDSKGAALTCRITTNEILMPQRWLADTSCYTASRLPDRFYVVVYRDERERVALRATLPPEIERFSVGDTYEVYVFRTEPASTAWLDLPIPDRELATFPIRVPATHLQIRRGKVAVESGALVATGEPGTVVSGPSIDLPKGDYTATWMGHGIESAGQITFKAMADHKRLVPPVTLDATGIPPRRSELVKLSFTLKRPMRGINLAVDSVGGGRVSLHELVIERTDR